MHALFGTLKDETSADYNKFCAHSIGSLKVTLNGAADLPAKDASSSSSHPFVELLFAGQTHATVPQRRTLSPSWNQTFEFAVYHEYAADGELVLLVKHAQQRGKAKDIGEVLPY